MERLIQSVLQRALGFDRYLYVFSRYKIATLKRDPGEGDVIHFAAMLPTDAVVLDIGANIGIMTVHLARRATRGRVHAFEPVPENFAALKRIVAHYKLSNVTLHQLALGEEDGELTMVMPVESSVRMQGLSRVLTGGAADPDVGEQYTVPQRRLDDLEFLADLPIAGIKIDVEDFEQYVFRGGAKLIERCQPVIYAELGSGENRTACLAFFEELGYAIGVLIQGAIVPFNAARHDKHNFFLLPPGHVDRELI